MDRLMKNRPMKANKTVLFLSNYFSFLGLALVVIVFQGLTNGRLIASRNLINIFNNFFSIGLGAMGVTFLMTFGELDLSVGAIVGFSAALAAIIGATNVALILPIAIITGLIVGVLNGIIIAKLNVEPFIATLAMSFVARGLTTFLLNGTVGIPVTMRVFDSNWIKILVFVCVAAFFYIVFEYTAFGKRCRSVGSAPEAARQSGVAVARIRILAFTIAGIMCGLIGFFSLVRTSTASSSTGSGFEFEVILAVLFGGMPLSGGWAVKFRSAVVGSVIMAILKSGMSLIGINGLIQQLIQGILLIVIAYVSFDRRNQAVIK